MGGMIPGYPSGGSGPQICAAYVGAGGENFNSRGIASISRDGVGVYTITFAPAFPAVPVVQVAFSDTFLSVPTLPINAAVVTYGADAVVVNCSDFDGVLVDAPFTLIAIEV